MPITEVIVAIYVICEMIKYTKQLTVKAQEQSSSRKVADMESKMKRCRAKAPEEEKMTDKELKLF